MRVAQCLSIAALILGAFTLPAGAQLYVTSVTAAIPDSAGKVPGFNKVPGSAIENWANGVAQAVLVHAQYYNYCVSLASATAQGHATVTFKIAHGTTDIQSGTIIRNTVVGSDGIWYFCSGYTQLPDSPGTATLTGAVAYRASGSTKPVVSKLIVPVLLQ